MAEGPYIAEAAALIGDPARANMLCAVMDGGALTAAELAHAGGVAASTASAHLGRLEAGGLLSVEKQGRHRYYRLANAETARVIEALSALAPVARPRLRRPGPNDPALRFCRTCYDHLAGEAAVAIVSAMREADWLGESEEEFVLGPNAARLALLGVDADAARKGRRRYAPRCLDWSERRAHLGGALGAALLSAFEANGWARRAAGTRATEITPSGAAAIRAALGVDLSRTAAA